MMMNNFRILFFIIMSATQLMACDEGELVAEKSAVPAPWWQDVPPIIIAGDKFYGDPCSVTRVSQDDAGVTSVNVIFTAPRELLTSCAQRELTKNYLDYDGEFIILNVDRQTFGVVHGRESVIAVQILPLGSSILVLLG
jgi:hypothetical protein